MMSENTGWRRLRGVIRNAAVWGAVWGGLGTAVATLFRLSDKISPGIALMDGIGMGVRIGVMGAIASGVFATFISLAYSGKRLSEISWVRFGIGGCIVAGVFVPGFLQTMNLITGGGLVPWNLVADDFLFSALFGGITAAGTMKLAQMDEAANPVTVQSLLERMEQDALGAGAPMQPRARNDIRAAERRS
jgi:hypothetical protein